MRTTNKNLIRETNKKINIIKQFDSNKDDEKNPYLVFYEAVF